MKYQWLVFAVTAAIAWGAYVPAIHHGQLGFDGKSNPNSPMRAFLFVGLAYFLLAVIIPGLWLATHTESADTGFTLRGVVLSTLAGFLGAAGALGVIFALKAGGRPLYVAPLVFAGAPIINVLVSMIWDGVAARPRPQFFVGLLLAAAGAALVLLYRPAEAAKHAVASPAQVVSNAPLTPR